MLSVRKKAGSRKSSRSSRKPTQKSGRKSTRVSRTRKSKSSRKSIRVSRTRKSKSSKKPIQKSSRKSTRVSRTRKSKSSRKSIRVSRTSRTRKSTSKSGRKSKSNIDWDKLEKRIETTFEFQCALSKNSRLFEFIVPSFIKITHLLYDALLIHVKNLNLKVNEDDAIEYIENLYYPMKKDNYILRPGIEVKGIVDAVINNKNITPFIEQSSLNQIMGAMYGWLSNPHLVYIVLKASLDPYYRKEYPSVYKQLIKTTQSFRSYISLPKKFSEFDLIEYIEKVKDYSIDSIDSSLVLRQKAKTNVLFDMLRKKGNASDREYIRVKRAAKGTTSTFKHVKEEPSCPKFTSVKKSLLVEGQEWYDSSTSLFGTIMNDFGRHHFAGPSGSSQIYLSIFFELLGVKKTRENVELLLLCIISDFVPLYHSLTEVIMVFSQDVKKKFGYKIYTIDMNTVKWLVTSLSKGRLPIPSRITPSFFDELISLI